MIDAGFLRWACRMLVAGFGVFSLAGCSEWFRSRPQAAAIAGPPPHLAPDRPVPPSPSPPEGTYPTARPVPGRAGLVFSPYNHKAVDVSGLPSGRLVADPHFPREERKFFHVP